MTPGLRLRATALASFLLPTAILAAAYVSEAFGLVPCEMCWWQRYAHMAAAGLGLAAIALSRLRARQRWTALVAVVGSAGGMLASAVIGVMHTGVERHWWAGFTACTGSLPKGLQGADLLDAIMKQPLIRCDTPQLVVLGLSMASWNAIISTACALWLLRRIAKRPTTARPVLPLA